MCIFYDAIDLSSTGAWNNKKANIEVALDTIDKHTFSWELAVKNYDVSFQY